MEFVLCSVRTSFTGTGQNPINPRNEEPGREAGARVGSRTGAVTRGDLELGAVRPHDPNKDTPNPAVSIGYSVMKALHGGGG